MAIFSHYHSPCEAEKFVFVRPENRLVELDIDIEKDVVEVYDNILLSVPDDNEEASFLFLRIVRLSNKEIPIWRHTWAPFRMSAGMRESMAFLTMVIRSVEVHLILFALQLFFDDWPSLLRLGLRRQISMRV